jgi:glucose-1-phosphate cytidylyltransferase
VKVVLLAGGLGTRLREETEFRPKPMVPVGGKPILWHIMKNFSIFALNDFVVCAGYRGEVIRQYFRDFETMNSDFTVRIGSKTEIKSHGKLEESGWVVTIADTGQETMTGGRLFKVKDYVGNETFICTYGDGLADVNISELLKFHKSHGKIATVTTVRPISRFGVLDLKEDGTVERFREKPQADGWINAGFFVFEPAIFNYLNQDSVLETEPLSTLAAEGQLVAFRHEGFWQPMDTFRELTILNEMWDSNSAPWKVWK